jgi:uncharacterized protein DUF4398
MRHISVSLALLLSATACGGSFPAPRDQLASSEAALRAADVAGAPKSPQSALHLKRAKEQIEAARALMADEEYERADWTLKRAQADAELALAIAKQDSQKKEAAEAKEKLDELKKSLQAAK